jgi:hypothetical protein
MRRAWAGGFGSGVPGSAGAGRVPRVVIDVISPVDRRWKRGGGPSVGCPDRYSANLAHDPGDDAASLNAMCLRLTATPIGDGLNLV